MTAYLLLVCEEKTQRQRLQARPASREPDDYDVLTEQTEYNQWLKTNAQTEAEEDDIILIDTTDESLETTT